MVYQEWILKDKWFSDTNPVSSVKATGTLTFTGVSVITETITIGTEVYEFCTSAPTGSNIGVVIGADTSADNAVTKLAEAINENSLLVTAVANTTSDTVVVTGKLGGVVGNDITSTETCTNASWGGTVLSGGIDGTPCTEKNSMVFATPYYYICTKEGNKSNVEWQRFTPASY